ncbi:MAG TPA: cyclodeaminase/cyclohydrolase family protein [Streptosporangiaceae bacterium]|jgi:formiminotetrahydrofolate cyclodeaminase
MHDETIGTFLEELAAKTATPGGGAVAALHAAEAAALIAMVGRYSSGPRYAEHAKAISGIVSKADELRTESLELAAADAAAFGEVAAAYALPRDTEEQKTARSEAISDALITAADPPVSVITTGAELLGLAERLRPIGNGNVLTDIGAAAEAIRAAIATGRLNAEVNLGTTITTPATARYREVLAGVDALVGRAESLSAAVRADITR